MIDPAFSPGPVRSAPVNEPPSAPSQLEQRAVEFEAVILAEMLRAAGGGQPAEGFGGGIGEEQFASFLLNEQARAIAARGGIGLAELILRTNLAAASQESSA